MCTAGIHASSSEVAESSNLSESASYVPDLPGAPQDAGGFLCGDVNEDGLVNVLDIISMVNYIMGSNPSPFNMDAADINADEGINVLDIIALVNIIMQVPGIPCGCVAPVLYEGQTYATVQIGDQCWLRENLNVGIKINSTQGGYQQQDNGTIEKYCYNNDEANCAIYGGLYEWPEAMQYVTTESVQGICPAGWHIATDNEWKILEGTVDSQYPVGDPEWDGAGWRGYDAGGNLKEAGTSHWFSPNTGATNSSGFTGLPGGIRSYNSGSFYNLGAYGHFWSSSQYSTIIAWYRSLYYSNASVNRNYSYKDYGFSVRCLKGCWPQPDQANAGPDQLDVPGTSVMLAANIPAFGSGVWSIVSGTGGTFVDPWSPTAEFQGIAGNEYNLSWTITTQCGSSSDQVQISFAAGFSCGNDLVYEGQSYATVQIGTQCWMAENLNVGLMIISTSGGFQQTDNDIIERYCYENDPTYCDTYGGLYEWPEVMQYMTTEGAQGICPAGWHIPTDNEWKILEGTVDSKYGVGSPEWDKTSWRGLDAGGNLKEAGTVHWIDPNEGATNSSGFTGLPAGNRSYARLGFELLGYYSYFWTSSQYDTDNAWTRYLYFNSAYSYREPDYTDLGFSVRCLKDD
ncbi:MAG: FISUMP domain-containing protein [Bacteroidales bacterium]|nr:FISUMP domain-containing protein [Bacteroidales bacterium]